MALDNETLNLLLDAVRRFVNDRLVRPRTSWPKPAAFPTRSSRKCATWACSACRSPRIMAGWA